MICHRKLRCSGFGFYLGPTRVVPDWRGFEEWARTCNKRSARGIACSMTPNHMWAIPGQNKFWSNSIKLVHLTWYLLRRRFSFSTHQQHLDSALAPLPYLFYNPILTNLICCEQKKCCSIVCKQTGDPVGRTNLVQQIELSISSNSYNRSA